MKHYDVIVIGAGHAGCEAALASARLGCATALVTLKEDDVGVMSCNPAIGGLGKGHLVREIDALGGAMGLAADASGIQFRLLNRTKGPAVRGPRTQSDRKLYKKAMAKIIDSQENLDLIEAEVIGFRMTRSQITGVSTSTGELASTKVILTTGTFLGGTIHIGDRQISGGRMGSSASQAMAAQLRAMDLPMGRLKTGTPPRLSAPSINWKILGCQDADADPSLFSFLSIKPGARQIACGVTHTNATTHDIIRSNLAKSALYGGQIEGVGPRYCPSIEDKVTRFADKDSHLVFLEPEGLDSDVVYPNGISTSLPEEVQLAYVRSMKGLEDADILQPGYAIEYDYVDPRALKKDLSLKADQNLFLAGQINGTTGYEEAAGQGLVAGLNAARAVQGLDPYVFSRAESYLGVMIDDLTTVGVTEPYRMFTSRAEFRLLLRADNADRRLTPIGQHLGLIDDDRWSRFSQKLRSIEAAKSRFAQIDVSAKSLSDAGAKLNQDAPRRTALEALALSDVTFDVLRSIVPEAMSIDSEVGEQLRNDALYATYTKRQARDVENLREAQNQGIPDNFDFSVLSGLSNELKQKIQKHQPDSMHDLARIEGMTPAALLLVRAALMRSSMAHVS